MINLAIYFGLLAAVLGDGCLIAAATLAASMGGGPLVWGLSFGISHALFVFLGYSVTDSITKFSETTADVVVILTLLMLLKHFLHHHKSHVKDHSCSCANHAHEMSVTKIVTYALLFSLHALGSGAILHQSFPAMTQFQLLLSAIFIGSVVGSIIGTSALATNSYRAALMRVLDRFPGLVVGALVAAACWFIGHIAFGEHDSIALNIGSLIFGLVVAASTNGRLIVSNPQSVHSHLNSSLPVK